MSGHSYWHQEAVGVDTREGVVSGATNLHGGGGAEGGGTPPAAR